jgi:hypothetical protein
MIPMPPGKYVGALSLCVEEIKGKKHIEFKFSEDKYDQSLGQYYLSESQTMDKIVINQYPNTGIFFWFSIISNVKITRRRMKINSYLSVEKFTPEFFLIDFQYFEPYANNPISRILCLPALFDLVKITLEKHFPGSKLTVIHNGFNIIAPNTHTRVKISAVARYCLDKLKVGNSCNKTDRYVQLKEKVYKDLTDRIMTCGSDLVAPKEFTAIAAMSKMQQLRRVVTVENVETVNHVEVNHQFHKSIDFPEHIWVLLGMGDARPTFGWIGQALDFENKTLNVEFFEKKHHNYLRKRLAPIIKAKFDYYSGGLSEPMQEQTVTVEKFVTVTRKHHEIIREEFPEYANHKLVHREVRVVPVCEMIGKISTPKKASAGKSEIELELSKKSIEKKAKAKKSRLDKRSESVVNAKKQNIDRISSELISRGKCTEENVGYVANIVNRLVEKRVRSSGILYSRINKKEFNALIKSNKKRFREKKLDPEIKYNVSRKHSRMLKALRKENSENSELKQLKVNSEYIYPYITNKSGLTFEDDNDFKLFLMKRRLTDYGISWNRTESVFLNFDIVQNRPHLNRFEIPNKLRNLMRNMIQTVTKSR